MENDQLGCRRLEKQLPPGGSAPPPLSLFFIVAFHCSVMQKKIRKHPRRDSLGFALTFSPGRLGWRISVALLHSEEQPITAPICGSGAASRSGK